METRHSQTAGGIVIGDSGMLAMVKSRNSQSWLFPKGHIEEGETAEEAARREIFEESGLTNLEYIDDLGEYIRPRVNNDGAGYEEKHIRMFLFAAPLRAEIAPRKGMEKEIEEARWVPYREAVELLGSPHHEWFLKDRTWFASVFERMREAIQRD
jgi:8-oxo-dGTP pyrophosphatase MutT (NUDIX family)